jgi:hypothetical protein
MYVSTFGSETVTGVVRNFDWSAVGWIVVIVAVALIGTAALVSSRKGGRK